MRTHPDLAEDGFSLMEVVVAMAVFTVLATVSLGLLVNTTRLTGANLNRTVATNLVTTQLEAVRSTDAQSIPDGHTSTTPTVGGTKYTISQNASYIGSNATASVCSGTGDSLAYKLVTVTVSWPNMGNIKPVRGDTLRAVGVGADGLDATKGTLAVSIVGSTGQPTAGVDVTITPGGKTETTGDDGCVVFTELAPGSYSATASTTGYVGTADTQAASINNLAVTAGDVGRGILLYDTVRSVKVLFDAPGGAIVPAGLVLRAGDSYIPESTLPLCPGAAACTTAVPGTVNSLFPESYTIKAGSCSEGTPSQVAVDLRPVGANGTTVTVPVGAATVKVAFVATPTVGIVGRNVTFTHATQTVGCIAGETYVTSSATLGSTVVLPYGTWTVSAPVFNSLGATVSVVTQTVTFSPTNKTATINLLVAL